MPFALVKVCAGSSDVGVQIENIFDLIAHSCEGKCAPVSLLKSDVSNHFNAMSAMSA